MSLQSGAQVANAYSGLAGFEQARGQSRANYLGQKSNLVMGVQHTAQQGIAESYGSLGSALGGFGGGLFDSWMAGRKKPGGSAVDGSSIDLGVDRR